MTFFVLNCWIGWRKIRLTSIWDNDDTVEEASLINENIDDTEVIYI